MSADTPYTHEMWLSGVPEPDGLRYGEGDMMSWTVDERWTWFKTGISNIAPSSTPPEGHSPDGSRPYSVDHFMVGQPPPTDWTCEQALADGWTASQIDYYDPFADQLTDDEAAARAEAVYISRQYPKWRIFPYALVVDNGGSSIVVDRDYRPICRLGGDGTAEIIPPEVRVDLVHLIPFYEDGVNSPFESTATRLNLVALVNHLGIEAELRRRRQADAAPPSQEL